VSETLATLDLEACTPGGAEIGALARALIERFQDRLPLTEKPYAELAGALGVSEVEVLDALRDLRARGLLARIGPVFAPHAFGASTLAAMSVPAGRLEAVARQVSERAEVNHNYEREHAINLWFVVTACDEAHVARVLGEIAASTALDVLDLPMIESYHIDLGFSPWSDAAPGAPATRAAAPSRAVAGSGPRITPDDRRLATALEDGLALEPRPFERIARRLGWSQRNVCERLARLRAGGAVKRLGLVVRHHELGYRANAMVVLDVPDARVAEAGRDLATQCSVTLCYRRPRRPPAWPYNLFCMIHGRDRDRVLVEAARLRQRSGVGERDWEVLFSRRRFKQRGARYGSLAAQPPGTGL